MEFIKEHFNNIKVYLQSANSNVVKKYFSLLGYKYSSIIPNSNFFHFAAEAYIITSIKEGKENVNMENIVKAILETDVDQNEYLENLEILIGTTDCSDNEVKFSTSKLAKIFASNVEYEKKKNQGVSTKDFDLDRFFRKAVNYTLNELNNDEGEEKSLELLNVYEEFVCVEGGLTLEKFVEEYKNRMAKKSMTKNLKFCVQNPCEVFYFFCQTYVADLIKDLSSFNKQSTNVIYIGLAFVKAQVSHQSNKIKNYYNMSKKSYKKIRGDIGDKAEVIKKETYDRLEVVNSWLKKTYSGSKNTLKEKFPSTYERLGELHEKYYVPIQKRMTVLSGDSYNFVLNTYNAGTERLSNLKNNIEEKISNAYQISKEKSSHYVNIVIDKSRKIAIVSVFYDKLKANEEIFYKVLGSIQKEIKEFNLERMRSMAVNAYTFGKSQVMRSYKRFLGISEEEKSECNKESQKSSPNKQQEQQEKTATPTKQGEKEASPQKQKSEISEKDEESEN